MANRKAGGSWFRESRFASDELEIGVVCVRGGEGRRRGDSVDGRIWFCGGGERELGGSLLRGVMFGSLEMDMIAIDYIREWASYSCAFTGGGAPESSSLSLSLGVEGGGVKRRQEETGTKTKGSGSWSV